MQKLSQKESSGTKHLNGSALKSMSGKKESSVETVGNVLESLSSLVSKEVDGLMESVSKTLPKATAAFLKKNWRPVAISSSAAALVNVGTYLLISRNSRETLGTKLQNR
jgi:hypothetical protein